MKQISLIIILYYALAFNLNGQAHTLGFSFTKKVEATLIMSSGDTLKERIYYKNDYYSQPYIKMVDRKKYDNLYTPLQVEKYYFTLKKEYYEFVSVKGNPFTHDLKFLRRYFNGEEVSLYGITTKESNGSQIVYLHYFLVMKKDKWVEPVIGTSLFYKNDIIEHVGRCPGLKEEILSLRFKYKDTVKIFEKYDEWLTSPYYIY